MLVVALVLTAVFVFGVGYADKAGEAETVERREPGRDCAVVWDTPWWAVECDP